MSQKEKQPPPPKKQKIPKKNTAKTHPPSTVFYSFFKSQMTTTAPVSRAGASDQIKLSYVSLVQLFGVGHTSIDVLYSGI